MTKDTKVGVRIHDEENSLSSINIRIQRVQNGLLLKCGRMPLFCEDTEEVKKQVNLAIDEFAAWIAREAKERVNHHDSP